MLSSNYTGDTIVNSGNLTLGAGGRLGNGNYAGGVYVAGGAAFNYQNTQSQTLSGAITGTGTLRQKSGGDLILTGSAGNTINNLNITGGRVFINNANAITSSTTTTIGTNGVLDLGANPTAIGAITVQNNGGIATRVPAGTTLANVTLPGPGTAIFNNDDARTYPLAITSGQTLAGNLTVQIGGSRTTANAVGGVTLSGILSGSGGLIVKVNTNTLTLAGANSYSGDTTITNGTLKLGAGNVIPDGPGKGNVTVTGTLDLNTFSETINGLTGSGTVDTVAGGTPTLTVGGNDATSTFSGVITDTAGTLALTKIGSGTLTLAGANGNSGLTTISNGTLALSGAGTLGSPSGSLTLSGGQLDLGGLTRTNGAVSITAAAASGHTITSGSLAAASFAASNPNGNAIVSAILTGSGIFTKSGSGTVTLSGANSYSGATTISAGTVQLGVDNALPTGTALTIGAGNTVGTLDLATFNQTIAGLVVASTNDIASTNSVVIGAGKTLTVTTGFTNGINTAASGTTKLAVSGAGTFSVTDGTLQIGGSVTTGVGNSATLDMSGLTTFSYVNSSGILRVGDIGGSSGGGTGISTLILAATNTITALTLATSDSQSAGMTNYIKLGSGANTINATTINIGQVANRVQGGSLDFNTGTGILRIRNTAGTGRANMALGYGNNSGGNNSLFNNVDLRGHHSDLLLGTLNIAGRTGGSGTSTATFSFDTGTLDATTVTVGLRSSTSAGDIIGTLNLGGGTVTNGSLLLAQSTSASGGAVLATNNLTGGAVYFTNAATSITFGSASQALGGGATAVLNLTGGSLTVAGNIVKGATNGVVNSLLNLSGGTLDLGGKNIGNLGSNVTFNAESGTLWNVATINGTGGLTKTTAGTLVLAGVNAYFGDTTISAGTLKLGAANAIPDGTGKGNVAVIGTLDLNGFSDTINGLSGAGTVDNATASTTSTLTVGGNNQSSTFSGVINNTAGTLSLVKTGSGTLTLSGTNGYMGNTTVNAGTLGILNPTIAASSTVIVANGAFLQLNFAVTNRVAALVLNGVNKSPGVYNSTNSGGFITGAGSLQVAVPGPTLTSVTPNPVTGSSFPVTLGLTGSGFTGASAVLLTNLTILTGASYSPTAISDTNLSVSFVPGTPASSWNATVVNGTPSAQVGFAVTAPPALSINQNAVMSAGAGKVVLSGTGGAPGNRYAVVNTTNLTPPAVWSPLVTNTFNGSGSFSYTNTVSPGTPQLFLRIAQ